MQRIPAFKQALKKPGHTPGFFIDGKNTYRSGNH
jgi:hypothetical protein